MPNLDLRGAQRYMAYTHALLRLLAYDARRQVYEDPATGLQYSVYSRAHRKRRFVAVRDKDAEKAGAVIVYPFFVKLKPGLSNVSWLVGAFFSFGYAGKGRHWVTVLC